MTEVRSLYPLIFGQLT